MAVCDRPNGRALNTLHDHPKTRQVEQGGFLLFLALVSLALLAIAQSSNAEKISELTDAFAQFDVKQDGTITWKELLSVLSKNGIVHNKEEEEEMHSIFNSVDQDHTGYIKYTEFVAASKAHRRGSPKRPALVARRLPAGPLGARPS